MWAHPDIVESQQWTTITNRKSKGKAKASPSNVVGISTRETEKMSPLSLVQEKKSQPLLLTLADLPHLRLDLARST